MIYNYATENQSEGKISHLTPPPYTLKPPGHSNLYQLALNAFSNDSVTIKKFKYFLLYYKYVLIPLPLTYGVMMVKISLEVPQEMLNWLQEHPKINRSKLFRESVDTIRNPLYRQLSDTIILNFSTMGIVIISFALLFMVNIFNFYLLVLLWILSVGTVTLLGIVVVIKRRSKREWKNHTD